MRILVLNPPFLKKFSRPQRSPAVTKSGTLYFPIWLAFCVGVLEESGFEVSFIDAPARGFNFEKVLSEVKDFQPRLIIMDTCTPSLENDLKIGAQLKEALPHAFLVLVGPHVSARPEETLRMNKAIDALARREYEYTIRDLACLLAKQETGKLGREELKDIAGLSYLANDQVIHNPDRPFIEDLDALPWVSKVYSRHLRLADYFNANALYPMITLITSRGCPYRCSFCLYPQTLTGRKYRFRSIEDVLNEMEFAVDAFPEAKSIFFEDDTLTANKERCLALAEGILKRGIKIPWTANSRVSLDLETMVKIKAAGCRELCVGFESGEQSTLNSMGKGVKREWMFRFMTEARKAGLLIHGCFMIGFPGETAEGIKKTIDLAISLKPDTAQFYPLMIYPGTEAYQTYEQKGWITAKSYDQWLTPDGLHNCVVRNENLTSEELVQWCDLARQRFYLRPGYIAYKLWQMFEKPGEIIRTIKAGQTFFKYLLLGSRARE